MTTPEDTGDAPKKPSAIITIAVVLVLSAVAAGGGWFVGGMLAPQVEAAVPPAEAEAHGGEAEGEAHAVPKVVALDAITTNLAYPSENWVRLEVSLVFAEMADEAMAQTIHQDIIAYLRTVSLQQIEGARGFQHLKEDLTERAALRSQGKVASLMFRTFVIE